MWHQKWSNTEIARGLRNYMVLILMLLSVTPLFANFSPTPFSISLFPLRPSFLLSMSVGRLVPTQNVIYPLPPHGCCMACWVLSALWFFFTLEINTLFLEIINVNYWHWCWLSDVFGGKVLEWRSIFFWNTFPICILFVGAFWQKHGGTGQGSSIFKRTVWSHSMWM